MKTASISVVPWPAAGIYPGDPERQFYEVSEWILISKIILPSPAQVWTRFLRALSDGSLLLNAGVTLFEILTGLLVGALAATVLGYLDAPAFGKRLSDITACR